MARSSVAESAGRRRDSAGGNHIILLFKRGPARPLVVDRRIQLFCLCAEWTEAAKPFASSLLEGHRSRIRMGFDHSMDEHSRVDLVFISACQNKAGRALVWPCCL